MIAAQRQTEIGQFAGVDLVRMFHVKHFAQVLAAFPPGAAFLANASGFDAQPRQAGRSIVGAQAQAVFGAGGEHPVGLGHALQRQIIDHHRDIGIGAVERGRRLAERGSGSLEPRDQPLRGGFLIAGGAVDLACAIEPGDCAQLQIGRQCARIDVIILHRVTRLHDHRRRAARHCAHDMLLHIGGERGADPVGIDHVGVQPLGLEEHLMALAVAEAVNLVLDRGAIARAGRRNRAREQRRAVEIGADRVMPCLRGAGDGAKHLRVHPARGERRHGPGLAVRRLLLEHRPVDGAPVEPRRGSGLEARHGEICPAQLPGEALGGVLADAATLEPLLAAKQHAAEESAGAQHHAGRMEDRAVSQLQPGDSAARQHQRCGLALDQCEIGLRAHDSLHRRLESHPVGLHARAPHGAALGAVEHPVVDRARVCRAPDHAVERIDLAHQMALAQPADRRIAAHRADGSEVKAHQRRARTHAGRRAGGLNPGVTAADDEDIEGMHGAANRPQGANSQSGFGGVRRRQSLCLWHSFASTRNIRDQRNAKCFT